MDDWFHLSQMSFDINASLALDFEQQAQRTRDALGTNKRTPDADVPAGPIGDAYKRFSALALYLAEAYGRATAGVDYRDGYGRDVRAEAIAFLAKCIDRVICNYSFAEFAADPRGVISRIINAPILRGIVISNLSNSTIRRSVASRSRCSDMATRIACRQSSALFGC